MTAATATALLDLRLGTHDKARIACAVALRGVLLSAEESRRFLRSLATPFQPNARLAKAMAMASQVKRF